MSQRVRTSTNFAGLIAAGLAATACLVGPGTAQAGIIATDFIFEGNPYARTFYDDALMPRDTGLRECTAVPAATFEQVLRIGASTSNCMSEENSDDRSVRTLAAPDTVITSIPLDAEHVGWLGSRITWTMYGNDSTPTTYVADPVANAIPRVLARNATPHIASKTGRSLLLVRDVETRYGYTSRITIRSGETGAVRCTSTLASSWHMAGPVAWRSDRLGAVAMVRIHTQRTKGRVAMVSISAACKVKLLRYLPAAHTSGATAAGVAVSPDLKRVVLGVGDQPNRIDASYVVSLKAPYRTSKLPWPRMAATSCNTSELGSAVFDWTKFGIIVVAVEDSPTSYNCTGRLQLRNTGRTVIRQSPVLELSSLRTPTATWW